MTSDQRGKWEARHLDSQPGASEPSLLQVLPRLPRGRALDVAAGAGGNAVALARAGFKVVALDFSANAMRGLGALARDEQLSITPLIADLETELPFTAAAFDVVVNIRYLDRSLIPRLEGALRPGGMLFFDTFLIDQAALGHPSNTRFMLNHDELSKLLSGMELLLYHEGLAVSSSGKREWRATALARKNTTAARAAATS